MDSHKPIHLLIDGDITYHRAARRKHDDGTPYSYDEAVASIEEHYNWLKDHLKADRFTVVLSGPSGANFRKQLYEPYKGDRPTERPPLLDELKDYLLANYECRQIPNLEADDVLGILSTEPQSEETRIIVTIDKDLEQIPGFLFNPSKWENGIKETTKAQGDWKFYSQWLTGDSTDCYPGVPGIGPKKAEKLFEKVKEDYEANERRVPWRTLVEEAILALYEKHQLTYDYALTQARMARILRWEDFEDGQVKLWTPRV